MKTATVKGTGKIYPDRDQIWSANFRGLACHGKLDDGDKRVQLLVPMDCPSTEFILNLAIGAMDMKATMHLKCLRIKTNTCQELRLDSIMPTIMEGLSL